MSRMTLEELLKVTEDEQLLNIQEELMKGVVPSTGYAHEFCRKINRMIDDGSLCITENSYRRLYLPTLAKMVRRELARRYALAVKHGMLQAGQVTRVVKLQSGQVPGQLALEVTK